MREADFIVLQLWVITIVTMAGAITASVVLCGSDLTSAIITGGVLGAGVSFICGFLYILGFYVWKSKTHVK